MHNNHSLEISGRGVLLQDRRKFEIPTPSQFPSRFVGFLNREYFLFLILFMFESHKYFIDDISPLFADNDSDGSKGSSNHL